MQKRLWKYQTRTWFLYQVLCSETAGLNKFFMNYSNKALTCTTLSTVRIFIPYFLMINCIYTFTSRSAKWLIFRCFLFLIAKHSSQASASSTWDFPNHMQLDTPHSVRLLGTRNRSVTETSTWQNTTHTRQTSMPPGGILTRNPSKRSAADPRHRPLGHWARHFQVLR